MKKLSIGIRLLLWYVMIFALGQIVFGAGMWFILRQNLYDIVDDGLENQADDVRRFLQSQKKDATIAKLQEEANETYSIEHSGDYLALSIESGETIYRSPILQAHSDVLLEANQIKRPISRSRKIDGRPFRFLFAKMNVNDHVFIVQMGAPADDAVETLHFFRYSLLLFAPLLLLLATGVGYWMSRHALSPVDALVQTARQVSGTNLSSRLQKLDTGDELQRLSDTLNEMLDRIESAFQRVKQFTTDASHELRTPVSLIRTEAELALRRSRGEAEYKESLRHILLEAERTTTLIEQLLSLARADSGREMLQTKPVDLGVVLHNVVGGWQQVADIRGLEFLARIDDQEASIMGDETLLRRLADILLDNAFKYTPAPGSVELWLETRGEGLVLTVKDSGVGIAPEEHSRIFERFYRVDKARNRELGGTGLGLAIAEWIVTQHRGSITVASRPGEGATFRVELPRIVAPVPKPQPA